MHPKNKPPAFVPPEYHAELDRLTKAALMDLAWELAAFGMPDDDDTIAEIRKYAAAIINRREQD
jgi:hypothetical protein